jgi:hypothetical protein
MRRTPRAEHTNAQRGVSVLFHDERQRAGGRRRRENTLAVATTVSRSAVEVIGKHPPEPTPEDSSPVTVVIDVKL